MFPVLESGEDGGGFCVGLLEGGHVWHMTFTHTFVGVLQCPRSAHNIPGRYVRNVMVEARLR